MTSVRYPLGADISLFLFSSSSASNAIAHGQD